MPHLHRPIHNAIHRIRYRRPIRRGFHPSPFPKPNHAPGIITALKRAAKLRRRLTRLAPELFTYETPESLREKEKQAAIHREAIAALNKIYGSDPNDKKDNIVWWGERPREPSPKRRPSARQRKIELLWTELELWMGVAQQSFEARRQQFRPPELTLAQACTFLDLASTFGRFATGLDQCRKKKKPTVDPPSPGRFATDLERIYGVAEEWCD